MLRIPGCLCNPKGASRIATFQILMAAPLMHFGCFVLTGGAIGEALSEPRQGEFAIAVLGSLLGRVDLDAGGDVSHSDGGFSTVDMLSAGAAGAHGFPFDIVWVEACFVHGFESLDADEPVFAFVLRPEWTAGDPLNGSLPVGNECLDFRAFHAD